MKYVVLSLMLSGCSGIGGALTAKAEPTDLRYYSPEAQEVQTTGAALTTAPELRLGHVTSSSSLRARIVHQDSEYELGMYETRRWTDNPEVYVRRALERALFDTGTARQIEAGDVPTLDVEVISFEEVRGVGKRAGRVELRYTLYDDRHVIDSGTVVAEHPAESKDMAAIVAAIGHGMNDAALDVTRRVVRRLR